MATTSEVAKVVGTMAAAFPHAQVTQETYAVYARLLADIPVGELQAAALQCLATARFMPTIGELRDKVLELRKLAAADGAPTAQEAWAEALGKASYYHAPTWSHPRVAEAVRLIGGHKMLALAEKDELISHRARFLELYASLEGKERTEQAMLPGVKAAVAKMQEIAAKQRLALGVDDET